MVDGSSLNIWDSVRYLYWLLFSLVLIYAVSLIIYDRI